MEYKDIASVSGQSGLFKVLSPARSGVILETLNDEKKRMVAGIHQKVSVLDEISVFAHNDEGSVPLKKLLHKIYVEFEDDPGVDTSSSAEEFKAFFKHILPEYDENRVYVSDMKKIVGWYHILYKQLPDLLKKEPQEQEEEQEAKTKTSSDEKGNEKQNEKDEHNAGSK
jgi:hypothetical protein